MKGKARITRANGLGLLSLVCAGIVAEAIAVAHFHPKPAELIGSGITSSMDVVFEFMVEVKAVFPGMIVEQVAGIPNVEQVC